MFLTKSIVVDFFTVKYYLSINLKIYNLADLSLKMDKSTLQQKGDLLTIDLYEKRTKNNKNLSFQVMCKEIIRQQFDYLKFGKFVVNTIIVV